MNSCLSPSRKNQEISLHNRQPKIREGDTHVFSNSCESKAGNDMNEKQGIVVPSTSPQNKISMNTENSQIQQLLTHNFTDQFVISNSQLQCKEQFLEDPCSKSVQSIEINQKQQILNFSSVNPSQTVNQMRQKKETNLKYNSRSYVEEEDFSLNICIPNLKEIEEEKNSFSKSLQKQRFNFRGNSSVSYTSKFEKRNQFRTRKKSTQDYDISVSQNSSKIQLDKRSSLQGLSILNFPFSEISQKHEGKVKEPSSLGEECNVKIKSPNNKDKNIFTLKDSNIAFLNEENKQYFRHDSNRDESNNLQEYRQICISSKQNITSPRFSIIKPSDDQNEQSINTPQSQFGLQIQNFENQFEEDELKKQTQEIEIQQNNQIKFLGEEISSIEGQQQQQSQQLQEQKQELQGEQQSITVDAQNDLQEYQIKRSIETAYLNAISKRTSLTQLLSALLQKITLKKMNIILHSSPLCISFLVLSIIEGVNLCNTIILVHYLLYLFLSIRNFIINMCLIKSTFRIIQVLELYEKYTFLYVPLQDDMSQIQKYNKQLALIKDKKLLINQVIPTQESVRIFENSSEKFNPGLKVENNLLPLFELMNSNLEFTQNHEPINELLLKYPMLEDNEDKYNKWRSEIFTQNNILDQELKKADFIIESFRNMSGSDHSLIQIELDFILKFGMNRVIICASKIYSVFEIGYMIAYSIVQIQIYFCSEQQHQTAVVLGFYFSIVWWIYLVLFSISFIFLSIEWILNFIYNLFKKCKKPKPIKTIQFKNAITKLQQASQNFSLDISEITCIICYERFHEQDEVYLTSCCSKCYHKKCISEWFKNSNTCPLCRTLMQK